MHVRSVRKRATDGRKTVKTLAVLGTGTAIAPNTRGAQKS
jgi:hypothetical protein